MGIPERLVIRFNGVATGYDLTTPDRRQYYLRTPQDWAEFRISSVARALKGLSLGPMRSLGSQNGGMKDRIRKTRDQKPTKREQAGMGR